MTKTRSPHVVAREGSRALVDNKESKKASNRRTKNKLAVQAYRQRLKQDPLRGQQLKDCDKERAKKYRKRQMAEEEKDRIRMLQRQRQCRYAARKRAAAAAKDLPMPPARETRQDKEKADKKRERMAAEQTEEVYHTGGCHCGAVRFRVLASPVIKAIDCNCSICTKKQNLHFIVPEAKFELTEGEENLITYTFNTGQAKHPFCKTCGVQSFYRPRSNPDGYGVMPHCLDPGTVVRVDVEKFEGDQWEKAIVSSDVPSRSKMN